MKSATAHIRSAHREAARCMAAVENAAWFEAHGQSDRAERARATAAEAAEAARLQAVKAAAAKQVQA